MAWYSKSIVAACSFGHPCVRPIEGHHHNRADGYQDPGWKTHLMKKITHPGSVPLILKKKKRKHLRIRNSTGERGNVLFKISQVNFLHLELRTTQLLKRMPFESVLMRWIKMEPVIQSEGSQKEKHQYSLLMHIYGI